jgi:hypothetical protein
VASPRTAAPAYKCGDFGGFFRIFTLIQFGVWFPWVLIRPGG